MGEQVQGTTSRSGTYGGQSREERAADRRGRIMQAALELFAARSYDEVTVAEVCARAKVSKRYFYEDFTDRESLLRAVHHERNDWLLAGIAAAAPKEPEDLEALYRPMMTTLVQMLVEHPESARVIYINAPRMELRRRGLLRKNAELFGRLTRRAITRPRDKQGYERMLLALVAGVTEVIIDWLERGMTDDAEALVTHLTWFATTLLTSLR
ncbi:TetR/AcrR family transcriptional regulator [Streptomyces beijiangensis]|uniref:TetR/AcrR family transcriptional regulator n=1 Tax=Streptomyces beijiangensis TaxID=163361 RepID=A0A939F7K4_9ACTN|nr:TetR/AcrR family transcriptional regulator [Streptomyces beijiangensis]MBO0513281.1 TetR/AcrR family transcriptional regulator [Streptomyces beijiangensis]